MKLVEYVKDIFENGPELFSDEKIITKNGSTLKRNTKRLRECSLGLVSCSTPEEWYRICRLNCEPGTIIEEYDEKVWTELYQDNLALVRNELTKTLLKEREKKSATTLLNILSKRDSEHWADKPKTQTAEVKTGDETIKFTFEGI